MKGKSHTRTEFFTKICRFILVWQLIYFSLTIEARDVKRPSGPFPIKADVRQTDGKAVARIELYPEYAQLYNLDGTPIFRAGVLSDKGLLKIYTVLEKLPPKLIAYTDGLTLYDASGDFIGSYYRTPTYTYTFSKSGKKLGSVKCISWSAVCGAVSAVYLILLS